MNRTYLIEVYLFSLRRTINFKTFTQKDNYLIKLEQIKKGIKLRKEVNSIQVCGASKLLQTQVPSCLPHANVDTITPMIFQDARILICFIYRIFINIQSFEINQIQSTLIN